VGPMVGAGLLPAGQAIKKSKIGLRKLAPHLRYRKDHIADEAHNKLLPTKLSTGAEQLPKLEIVIEDDLEQIEGDKTKVKGGDATRTSSSRPTCAPASNASWSSRSSSKPSSRRSRATRR
jgi:hypothetical protein